MVSVHPMVLIDLSVPGGAFFHRIVEDVSWNRNTNNRTTGATTTIVPAWVMRDDILCSSSMVICGVFTSAHKTVVYIKKFLDLQYCNIR